MVLRIIPQMARGTHSTQVFRPYILRGMVEVGHRQRVPVRVKRLSGFSALFPASFTLPAHGFLFRRCYALPIGGIALTLHRHVLPPSAAQASRYFFQYHSLKDSTLSAMSAWMYPSAFCIAVIISSIASSRSGPLLRNRYRKALFNKSQEGYRPNRALRFFVLTIQSSFCGSARLFQPSMAF